jgi:16S rRNA (cytosine967-C5)-methyltransferase
MMIDPRPGECLLDACAGLGGKTAHMAQLMKNRGCIVALDRVKRRLSCLQQEMKRLGCRIVKPVVSDLKAFPALKGSYQFDRILVDAPCSGIGVIRRNPDTKWSVAEPDLLRLSAIQLNFLLGIADQVKPGGFIVYTVCSTEPEETDTVIHHFLSKRRDFGLCREVGGLHPSLAALLDAAGAFRTFPHMHDMDGFFSVRLKRK